jgi:hypothetical protein
MTDGQGRSQRLAEYRPSKTVLFWSCAGCVAATMIIGFTWGGWVTGGTAEEMAQAAADRAQAQVAASVCVEKFMAATDARPQLASLKEIRSSWQRKNFVEKGGWATVAGNDYDDTAELCAQRLMDLEAPAQEATATEAGTVTQ